MTGDAPIISIRNLHKRFGALHVLRGVDLDISRGEVFAMWSPSATRCFQLRLSIPTARTDAFCDGWRTARRRMRSAR